jgi:hypothetical protein
MLDHFSIHSASRSVLLAPAFNPVFSRSAYSTPLRGVPQFQSLVRE